MSIGAAVDGTDVFDGRGTYTGNVEVLPQKLAADMRQSARDAKVPAPKLAYMARCIGEITLETQIAGASLLTLTVNDSDWMLQASGFLRIDDDGLVPIIDVNFPPGSDSWWRLCMIEGTVDTQTTDPNLTLTFEDRIVSYLREEWGPFIIGKNLQTRAQCIARLVAQVGQKGGQTAGVAPISFVCPSENIVQPIASTVSSTDTSGVQIVTPPTAGQSAKTNKSQGIGVGAALTVKGTPITAQQVAVCNAALGAGIKLNAPLNALIACMYAGMGESSLGNDAGASQNVWQANSPGDYGPSPNWAEMATAFFQGTGDFQAGGAITCATRGDQIWQVANEVEANKVWDDSHQDSYAHEWTGGQVQGLNEAKAIVSAYGGGSLNAATGSTTASNPTSDVSQLTRGTSDNPDESSWDCIQRLASDVQWFAFSNADTLYYMDGYDLVGQKPAAYIKLVQDNGPRWNLTDGDAKHPGHVQRDVVASLNYTFDNTAFIYRSTHTRKGRVQRKSRIATPQTPSEIQLNLVCAYNKYRAGDVFVFQDAGPINGRWIVTDATRNVLGDTFTQFTLEPPIAPSPEPAETGTSSSTSIVSSANGVVDAAEIADAGPVRAKIVETALGTVGKTNFHYDEVRPMPSTLQADPCVTDCSGWATLCYKAAGAPDPNNLGYDGSGYTGTLEANGTPVSTPQLGDMAFWSGPGHAAIVTALNPVEVTEFGAPPSPATVAKTTEDTFHSSFIGYRSYIRTASSRNVPVNQSTRATEGPTPVVSTEPAFPPVETGGA